MYKVTKINAVENPQAATAKTIEEYRGSLTSSLFSFNDDHLSPSVDYYVIGDIVKPPTVGGFLVMDRWIRNGVLCAGRFSTSEVTKITEDGFETRNSVYKMEEVSEEDLMKMELILEVPSLRSV